MDENKKVVKILEKMDINFWHNISIFSDKSETLSPLALRKEGNVAEKVRQVLRIFNRSSIPQQPELNCDISQRAKVDSTAHVIAIDEY